MSKEETNKNTGKKANLEEAASGAIVFVSSAEGDAKDPKQDKNLTGVGRRIEKDAYVIEPLVRPKNRRRRALAAVMLAVVFLIGSVFQYGGNITGAYRVNAVSGNFGGKKTGVFAAAAAANDIKALSVTEIPVSLRVTSVEKDMSIRVLGPDDYPVVGYPFEIEVVDSEGEVWTIVNDERNGRIYLDEIESGDYTVSMLPLEGFITPEPVEVEVLDQVQFVIIEDISEKIVKQKDINSAEDDPQFGNTGNPDAGTPGDVVELKDTVTFVESRIVETESNVRYKGNIGEGGRIFYRSGELSIIIPEVENGYLTGLYSMFVEDPPEQPDPEEGGDEGTDPSSGEEEDIGGDIDLFEKDSSGSFIFDITREFDMVKTYYGWHDIDGSRSYFDSNGKKITGSHVIQGVSYTFNQDGFLVTTGGGRLLGIDVSTWQNHIDWNKVKAAGIEFVMIRAGFRGYSTGMIVEDDLFYTNLVGAKAAGLRVGVYFFSQAINEVEGVEEASMVISLIRKYGRHLDYPITIDSELSGAPGNTGRADSLSRAQRTAVCVAFCETVRSAGFTPMIYASKSWFENNLSVGSFGSYKIWLAHYTPDGAPSSYTGRYEMWQYTSRGSVNGIVGNVDMNFGYLGY